MHVCMLAHDADGAPLCPSSASPAECMCSAYAWSSSAKRSSSSEGAPVASLSIIAAVRATPGLWLGFGFRLGLWLGFGLGLGLGLWLGFGFRLGLWLGFGLGLGLGLWLVFGFRLGLWLGFGFRLGL